MRRVPATVVTGFLGGKTSLVRHLLGFDRPWQPHEGRTTRLVVIGKAGHDQATIAAALGS